MGLDFKVDEESRPKVYSFLNWLSGFLGVVIKLFYRLGQCYFNSVISGLYSRYRNLRISMLARHLPNQP